MRLINKHAIILIQVLCYLSAILATTTFTKESLSKFKGENGAPIYMAIKGIVYDLTKGNKFYGPSGSYHAFAGRDSTRAVAKWSLKDEDFKDDISDLTPEELESLDSTIEKLYKPKYPVVGYMDYYRKIANDL